MSVELLFFLAIFFAVCAGYVACYCLGYKHGYNDAKAGRPNKVFPEQN